MLGYESGAPADEKSRGKSSATVPLRSILESSIKFAIFGYQHDLFHEKIFHLMLCLQAVSTVGQQSTWDFDEVLNILYLTL
jgi:hypothetical protein